MQITDRKNTKKERERECVTVCVCEGENYVKATEEEQVGAVAC